MRRRIIGLAVWASVLTLALFGAPLAFGVFQYALTNERGDLERTADAVAIAVADEVERNDPVKNLGSVRKAENTEIGVYDDDGDRIAGQGPREATTEVREALDGDVGAGNDDGNLVTAVPITHDADVIGAVRAATPRSAVIGQVAAVWGALAAFAALVLTAIWLIARRQARRLARPLEQLSVVAHRLGDGDFSARTRPDDIPEIDAVGSALNNTAARLDNMLARERAFSAEASHQLRTPLAGLRLRLEAALEQPDRDPRPAIYGSLTDADRLEQTIDELLALARDRAGTAGPVELDAVLNEIRRDWVQLSTHHERSLEVIVEPSVPQPSASAAAVRQVLRVLVDNAFTHGAGTVTVSVREFADAVAIAVSDEGAGVQQNEGELFARRTDQDGDHGIGLALARRLAEAEGGRLHLSRPVPPTFTLLLPTVDPPIRHLSQNGAVVSSAPSQPDTSSGGSGSVSSNRYP